MKINGTVILLTEIFLTFCGALIISLLESESWSNLTLFNTDLWTFNWAQVWLLGGLIYTGLSLRFDLALEAEQIGVRTIFGQPTDVLGAGLPIVPPGLFALRVFTARVQQTERPGEPEQIFRGEESEVIPPGLVPPFRVTFTESITEGDARTVFGASGEYTVSLEYGNGVKRLFTFNDKVPADGISLRRTTEEVVIVIRWRIEDAISFVRYIGSEEEAEMQLEDEAFSVIQRIYPKISLAQAQANIDWINAILYLALQRRVGEIGDRSKSWGVHIEGVGVKNIRLHHGLNQAIADAAKAGFEGMQRERLADARRIEIAKEGEGRAAAEEALLIARAKGLEAIARLATDEAGRIAISTDSARELANAGNLVVSESGGVIGSLLALVGAGKKVVSKDPPTDSQSGGDAN